MCITTINSMEDFEKAYHFREAERCCANCFHGKCEFDGCATCNHPYRNDNGKGVEDRIERYNVSAINVCDLWEPDAKGLAPRK